MKFPPAPILALLAFEGRALWRPRHRILDRAETRTRPRKAALRVGEAAEEALRAEAPLLPRHLAASRPAEARLRQVAPWQVGAPLQQVV